MTIKGQNFEIFQGDTKQITISVTDEDGAILPLTGYDAIWVVYKQTSKELIISKTLGSGILIPTPTDGQIVIDLIPADTETINPGSYLHECEIVSGTEVSTVTTGIIKVLYSKA